MTRSPARTGERSRCTRNGLRRSKIKTNPEKYSRFGTGYHTEKKTNEVLSKWAMSETPIKEVLQTFKLTGLSASQMAKHENFPALLMYVKLYLDFKALKAMFAANP
ncbi:hypothetical protein GQ600_10891 [Phytophthora cactorum]|nr:hypothetical protein GQ600_10891 [Phytophthora cactorum]